MGWRHPLVFSKHKPVGKRLKDESSGHVTFPFLSDAGLELLTLSYVSLSIGLECSNPAVNSCFVKLMTHRFVKPGSQRCWFSAMVISGAILMWRLSTILKVSICPSLRDLTCDRWWSSLSTLWHVQLWFCDGSLWQFKSFLWLMHLHFEQQLFDLVELELPHDAVTTYISKC